MNTIFTVKNWRALGIAALFAFTATSASAYELAISGYASTTSAGFPYAVAMEGGLFKAAGVDISGIRGSNGGTEDVRGMLAGNLPFTATSLDPVLSAIKQGADLLIINEVTHSSATNLWVMGPNAQINSLADLKGKRIGFTTPQSAAQMLDLMLINKAGLTANDVKMVAAGSFGAELTLIDNGAIDIAYMSEPLYSLNKSKYKVFAKVRDVLPALNSVVGVTSGKFAKEHPDVLRGILAAQDKAIDYMKTNRKEAAAIIAKVYKLDPQLIQGIIDDMVDHGETQGIPYWSHGEIIAKDMDGLIDGLKLIGITEEGTDWRKYVDQSFLPANLKRDLK